MLAKRLHAEKIGFKITADTRILVTGGASVNLAILQVDFIIINFVFCFFFFSILLQVVADVFNAKVFTQVSR